MMNEEKNRLPYIYVALIDILGYRQRLKHDRDSGSLQFQNKLSRSLRVFDSVNDAIFNVNAISDTIIVTCRSADDFLEFLRLLSEVFVSFMGEGLYARGGIAYSRHFQRNHVTYSHSIARAYELEANVAAYPRIVIDPNIIEMYRSGEGLPHIFDKKIICVENGIFF